MRILGPKDSSRNKFEDRVGYYDFIDSLLPKLGSRL